VSTHPGNQHSYHGNPITEQNTIIGMLLIHASIVVCTAIQKFSVISSGIPCKKGCNSPLLSAGLHSNSSNGSTVSDKDMQKVSDCRNGLKEETQGEGTPDVA